MSYQRGDRGQAQYTTYSSGGTKNIAAYGKVNLSLADLGHTLEHVIHTDQNAVPKATIGKIYASGSTCTE